MAYKHLERDEDGDTTLDDYDFASASAALPTDQGLYHTISNDVAFTGVGVPGDCCNNPADQIMGTPNALFGGGISEDLDSYSSPEPTHIAKSDINPHPVQYSTYGKQGEMESTSDAAVRNIAPLQERWVHYIDNDHSANGEISSLGTAADQKRAMDTQAALIAAQALSSIVHNGPARTNEYKHSSNAPGIVPAMQWVMETGYTPGMGSGRTTLAHGPYRAASDQLASVPGSSNRLRSATTPSSSIKSFECSYRPCKANGEIARFTTAKDRNKHERRVHGPKEGRPHGCPNCERRFNHPREVERHFGSKHSQNPSTARCHLCTRTFKHRIDHLDRHLEGYHRLDALAIQRCREARTEASSASDSGVLEPSTPSMTASTSSNSFGLLTPPPSRTSRGF